MKNNYVIVGRERVFLKFVKYATTVLLPIIAFLISYIAFQVTITGPVVWLKTFIIVSVLVLILIGVTVHYMVNDLLKQTYNERVDVDGETPKTINAA